MKIYYGNVYFNSYKKFVTVFNTYEKKHHERHVTNCEVYRDGKTIVINPTFESKVVDFKSVRIIDIEHRKYFKEFIGDSDSSYILESSKHYNRMKELYGNAEGTRYTTVTSLSLFGLVEKPCMVVKRFKYESYVTDIKPYITLQLQDYNLRVDK